MSKALNTGLSSTKGSPANTLHLLHWNFLSGEIECLKISHITSLFKTVCYNVITVKANLPFSKHFRKCMRTALLKPDRAEEGKALNFPKPPRNFYAMLEDNCT